MFEYLQLFYFPQTMLPMYGLPYKNCFHNSGPICFLLKKSVLENISKNLLGSNPYLLTILLSIPFNKLPWPLIKYKEDRSGRPKQFAFENLRNKKTVMGWFAFLDDGTKMAPVRIAGRLNARRYIEWVFCPIHLIFLSLGFW